MRTQSFPHLASLVLVILAASLHPGACASNVTTDAQSFSEVSFDYLIVGGGTAGLVLAARLSENAGVQVGVIEAGTWHRDDPLVDIPSTAMRAWGNPDYDWSFRTIPQPGAGNRSIVNPRGKMLGGSSGLNNMAWCRATRPEYDALASFAQRQDWDWNGILPYMRKAESVFLHQDETVPGVSSSAYNAEYEGFHGPIQAAFNTWYPDTVGPTVSAANKIGLPNNTHPDNGNTTGIFNSRVSVDRTLGVRSYAASSYYAPIQSRKNLHVIIQAQATKLLMTSATRGGLCNVTGVQFSSGSSLFSANASREVILSAGAYQSPQLLELSGIGNSSILKSVGISPLIDLPQVGENLQDHLFVPNQFTLNPGLLTFDSLTTNTSFEAEQEEEYNRTWSGALAATNSFLSFLPFPVASAGNSGQTMLQLFDRTVSQLHPSPLQAKQYSVQREWLNGGSVPQLELILWSQAAIPSNLSSSTILSGGLHHLSRGSVHINSSNPLQRPSLDSSWLTNEYDVQTLLQAVKLVRNMSSMQPLSDIINATFSPAANLTTDEDLIGFIRESVGSAFHPMGTIAMAPRDIGGVVDGSLKVYGTTNLRVCDASILPISIGTHLQATVYAIAEKLADMIRVEM